MWCSPPYAADRQGLQGCAWVLLGEREAKMQRWHIGWYFPVACFLYQGHGKQTMWCACTRGRTKRNVFNDAEKSHTSPSNFITVTKLIYQTHVSSQAHLIAAICLHQHSWHCRLLIYHIVILYCMCIVFICVKYKYNKLHMVKWVKWTAFFISTVLLQNNLECNGHSAVLLKYMVLCNGFCGNLSQ